MLRFVDKACWALFDKSFRDLVRGMDAVFEEVSPSEPDDEVLDAEDPKVEEQLALEDEKSFLEDEKRTAKEAEEAGRHLEVAREGLPNGFFKQVFGLVCMPPLLRRSTKT